MQLDSLYVKTPARFEKKTSALSILLFISLIHDYVVAMLKASQLLLRDRLDAEVQPKHQATQASIIEKLRISLLVTKITSGSLTSRSTACKRMTDSQHRLEPLLITVVGL